MSKLSFMTFRKHKRKKLRKKRDDGPVMVRSPFAGIDQSILREAIQQTAELNAKRFPELFETIKATFQKAYPLHIIAVIAQYGLAGFVSDDGVAERSSRNQIEQCHVELLFAIAQMTERSTWGCEPANPEVIQETIDAVTALFTAFQSQRFARARGDLTQNEQAALILQESLRLHTQYVRNWGYFSKVVEISLDLYAPLNDAFRQAHGFSATEAIRVLAAVAKSHENRTNQKFQRLQKVLRERNRSRITAKFKQLFPEFDGDFKAWLDSIPKDAPKNNIAIAVMDLTDRLCVEISCVDVDTIADETALSTDHVIRVLSAFSRNSDSLLEQKPEFIFLNNPVWEAPFLHDGGAFFSPIPQIAFSHIHRLMRRLAKGANAMKGLSKARADYLEAAVEMLIKQALPSAQVTSNLKWKIGKQQYETDVLAVVDKTVLIVEAKSAALTPEGLRGAPDRAKRHVRELIQEPALQSLRLEQVISDARQGDQSAQSLVRELGIDAERAEIIIRLSVTLDDFSMVSSSELDLKEAGWIQEDLPLPPTINVADLGCITDLLDEPVFFLHYLIERDRIQKTHIFGDELDFLGLYLDTGFNVSAIADGNINLALTGMSNKIDHFYNSLDAGVSVPKPKPVIHKDLLSIVRACQDRQAEGWTKLGAALLEVGSFKEQKGLFNAIAKLKKKVRRNYRNPKHECVVAVAPPSYRKFAYIFHVYPEAISGKRDHTISEIAGNIMAEQERDRCIVVSKMIEKWDQPYSLLAIATAADEVSAQQ